MESNITGQILFKLFQMPEYEATYPQQYLAYILLNQHKQEG